MIKDGLSGAIVYMPPEASDVSGLMKDLVSWIDASLENGKIPVAIIAALAHYQFATIHPYYDGNGRTARLITNYILHYGGYGLKGIYSLEAYYAKNLQGYYDALAVENIPNYYMGRAQADLTYFLKYFMKGMAISFTNIVESSKERIVCGSVEYVPETMLAKDVLNVLIKKRKSLAVVLDEYGGTSGIMTVEDIVEELVGEIEDEHDTMDFIEEKLKDNTYLFSARLEVDYINETYRLQLPESENYETLGGFIVNHTEEIPEQNQEIRIHQFHVTIKEVSNTKIELVTLKIVEVS